MSKHGKINYIAFNDRKGLIHNIFPIEPWRVWLSGLSVNLQTKMLWVGFPARAQAWVAGQVPSGGCVRGNRLMDLLHIDVSVPLFFPPFSSLKIKCF